MEKGNVNVYFVPNNKNDIGGKFYNVYINRNEKLDLTPFLNSISNIDELTPTVQSVDETFKPAGGIIVKRNEEIGSASIYTPDLGGISLNEEEQHSYQSWLELDKLSTDLYQKRKADMEDFIARQRLVDEKLAKIEEEKQLLSEKLQKSLRKVKGHE